MAGLGRGRVEQESGVPWPGLWCGSWTAGGNFRGVLGRGSPLMVMTKLHLLAHFHLSLSEYSYSPNPQDLAAIWKFSKWVMTSF